MVRANRLNGRFLTFILLAFSMTVLTVAAISPNWFEALRVNGIIVETESNIVKATIDLGNLTSATAFSASGNATLTIAESGGLRIEKFIMGHPEYTADEGYVYERYLTNRFYHLWLNLTIAANTINMPIVRNGTFYSYSYWYSEYSEYPFRYYRYYPWSAITLPQGTHTIAFTIYGTTALTTKSLGVEMVFYFALTPP